MASSRPPYAVVNLANAFLGGSWTLRSLVNRGEQACRVDAKWVRIIVRRLLAAFGTPPSFEDLLAFLLQNIDPSSIVYLGIGRNYWIPRTMTPLGAQAGTWNVPAITSFGQLADWLVPRPD